MKWSNVFQQPVKVVSEPEAQEMMKTMGTDSYQLLDVRTHEEYEDEHIPGATLVPLNELVAGQGDLDPEKPTIVYCRSGGRSQAASQWLNENGFKEVYDISYHIRDWLGIQLPGEYSSSLDLINPDIDFPDAFALSYAMEEGLQQFYLRLEQQESRIELKDIYNRLAGFENLHKEELKKRFVDKTSETFDYESALTNHPDAIEGGDANRISPFEVITQMKNLKDIFGLALAIEAQSFDLYVRLANKAEAEGSREAFMQLADEEKKHMDYITKEMAKF